jgi:hypothetical protein
VLDVFAALQLYQARLNLLAKRQSCHAAGRARSPSSCEPRERLAMTRSPVAAHTATAATRHLPDSITARSAVHPHPVMHACTLLVEKSVPLSRTANCDVHWEASVLQLCCGGHPSVIL